jgi:hypothetical protein
VNRVENRLRCRNTLVEVADCRADPAGSPVADGSCVVLSADIGSLLVASSPRRTRRRLRITLAPDRGPAFHVYASATTRPGKLGTKGCSLPLSGVAFSGMWPSH